MLPPAKRNYVGSNPTPASKCLNTGMKISHNTLEIIRNLRDCVRSEKGNCQDLLQTLTEISDFSDALITSGFFVTKDGRIVDGYWWLVLPDGSYLDPEQDRFTDQEGFGDICLYSEKDSRHKHYFPYTGKPGIPMDVLNFADRARARHRNQRNRQTFGEMLETTEKPQDKTQATKWQSLADILEAFGGRPVGDPNAQQHWDIPNALTVGGQSAVPQEEPDEEFKPEEFEDTLRQLTMDDLSDGEKSEDLSLSDLEDENIQEVDHPEYMPDEGPARHDPNLNLGRPEDRQPGYNTGHPKP